MKDEVSLKLEDAYTVLDIMDAYKALLEANCEAAASKASRERLLDRWKEAEAVRVKLLVEVKKAEGQIL